MKKRMIAILIMLLVVLVPMTSSFADFHKAVISRSTVSVSMPKLSFSTTTLDGKEYSSSVIKNYDLIMVNCWGEWCGACTWEMPYLQQISQDYKNVLILGVWYGDSVSKALEVAQENGVTYPLIHPTGMLVDCLWASNSFPHTIFFDSKGNQVGDMEVGATSYYGWESAINSRLALLPPRITTQPKAVSVFEGKTATFKVVASRADSYKWQYQKPGESAWTSVKTNGTSATYSLTTAAKHNGYKYRCKVTNANGSVYTKAVTLTVKVKPVITTQPKSATVYVGKTATFKVVATGATSYKWQYQKPGTSTWTDVSNNGTSATYSLTTAARHNGYKYRCKVINANGSVYTNTVTLTVQAKPVITTQPKNATVTAGTLAAFQVKASNATGYQWQYQKPGTSTWTNVSKNGTSATYMLTTEARHNGYKYRCKVTNAVGSVTSSVATLTVE